MLILATALLAPFGFVQAEEEFVMGVFPRRPAIETTEMFAPIAAYLSEQLGRPVRLETASNFESFWQGVAGKRYDLVHYNQLQYVKSRSEHGYEVILKNEEHGSATIAGLLAVHTDSGIDSVKQLRGKTIVFGGGKDAMMAYVAPTALLRETGLKNGDYSEEFTRHPPSAITAVLLRQADAIGAGHVLIQPHAANPDVDLSKLKVLAQGKQLAQIAWAVRGDMAPTLRRKIQALLANLDETAAGRALLSNAKLTGLRVARDEEYNPHRRMIFEVVGEQYK